MKIEFKEAKNNFQNIKIILETYLGNTGLLEGNSYNLHLGVFVEPFLSYVLDGRKTWESRFSLNKVAPYNRVKENDLLLIKKSGGPVLGVGMIRNVLYFRLDEESFLDLQKEYADLLCIEDPVFWENKKFASYATIMKLDNVMKVKPLFFEKKDRRGWIVYEDFHDFIRY